MSASRSMDATAPLPSSRRFSRGRATNRPHFPSGPRTEVERERRVVVVGFVVVAVTLAGLGVYLGGGLSGLHASRDSGALISFATARIDGSQVVDGLHGNGWSLVAAYGFDSSQPGGASVATSWSIGWGCTASPVNASPVAPLLSAPPDSPVRPAGTAPWWGLIYYQNSSLSSSGELLLVQVTDGRAAPVGIFSGACTSAFANLEPIPTSVDDSPGVVATAQSLGGASFLSHDPNASVLMELTGPSRGELLGAAAIWQISYNNCGLLDYGGWQVGGISQFQATIGGAAGNYLDGVNSTETCASLTAPVPFDVNASLALGAPTLTLAADAGTTLENQGCGMGDFCYQIPLNVTATVLNSTGYLFFTPEDFQLEVLATATAPLTSVVGYEISGLADNCGVNCVGQSPRFVRAWSVGAVEGVWSGAPASYIDWGISTLWIDMGTTNPAGLGYALEISGVEVFSGDIFLALP